MMPDDSNDCPYCEWSGTRPGTCDRCIDSERSEAEDRGPPENPGAARACQRPGADGAPDLGYLRAELERKSVA